MADFVYIKFELALFSGFAFNPVTDTLACVLVNETGSGTTYTPNQNVDEFLSAIPSGARISTVELDNVTRTTVAGKVSIGADPLTFPSVTGSKVDSAVFYVKTGVDGTSRLICRYTSITGFPFNPTGDDMLFTLPNTSDKLLSLSSQ